MISNCVNPACRAPFSLTREGRIFNVDGALIHSTQHGPELHVEQYWLCRTCSQSLKVVVENGRITTAPIEIETFSLAG